MYLTHYKFEIKPFESSPDPGFIWLGEKHQEVLAALKFGVREDKGFSLLTGGIGSGKTTLASCFLNQNGSDSVMVSIPDPDLTVKDFFRLLAYEFGFNIDFKTRGEFLLKFKNCLDHAYSDQKKVLLTIDEAQRLDHGLLEQIRLLATIERRDLRLFSIILVGQNDLHECLVDAQNRGLPKKIAVRCHLESFTEAETRDYINHRLRAAGSQNEIFSPGAIAEIFSFSQGCPRLINTVCDRALLTGYAEGISRIDRKIVQQSAAEFVLPGERDDNSEQTGSGIKTEIDRKEAEKKPGTDVRKDGDRQAPEKKPDTAVKKENICESAGKAPAPQAEKEKNHEQASKVPIREAGTEYNREAAAGAPDAEADSAAHLDATDTKPQTGPSGPVQFTWGLGAEPKPLWVSVNDPKLLSRDKSTLSPRTIMVAAAILMLTAVVLYLWLGVGS